MKNELMARIEKLICWQSENAARRVEIVITKENKIKTWLYDHSINLGTFIDINDEIPDLKAMKKLNDLQKLEELQRLYAI